MLLGVRDRGGICGCALVRVLLPQLANRRQFAIMRAWRRRHGRRGRSREQGVSKAGSARLRKKLVQLAWLWLRHRPGSARRAGCMRKPIARSPSSHWRASCWSPCKRRHRRRRHRRCGAQGRCRRQARRTSASHLTHSCSNRTMTNPPRPDQSRPIRADEPMDCMASKAVAKSGFVLSSGPPQAESWYGTPPAADRM